MRWQMIAGAILTLVIYVVIGGFAFWLLETRATQELLEQSVTKLTEKEITIVIIHRELTAQLIERLNTTSSQGLNVVINN